MPLLDRLRITLAMLFRRRTATTRLTQELQFHLDQQIAENEARGMTPHAARAAALRAFGNPTLLRDQTRSTWTWNSLEAILRDLRYATRTLTRSPGFSLIAIVIMALGIGATTSLFTIVNAVLLKPLPFRDPASLVALYEHFLTAPATGSPYNVVSPGDYRAWRSQTHGFEDMAAFRQTGFNLTSDHAELPEVVEAQAGSANLFALLGVQPALGRAFTSEEDQPHGNRVALLTWSLFERRFNGDPNIIGKTIRLDTNAYTIVGILPRSFVYPNPRAQLWVPYAQTFPPGVYDAFDNHQSHVIARLKPNISAIAATREAAALQARIHQAHASRPVSEDVLFRPLIDDVVENVKTPLWVLLGAVACLLLIACLNLSNLLVARTASRRRESAIRGALGGSRLTLIRQQMTESLLLCAAGGLLGVALSFAATRWLATHWSALPRAEAIHVDAPILLFAVALVVLAALLAGLLPALASTGKSLLAALQESSRSVGGSNARATLRKTLLTAEIALTVVLLLAAGLLFKSFLHLRTANLGCNPDHVLTMQYGLPDKQYDTPEKVTAFHEAILDRVSHLPGVQAAALVSTAPAEGYEGDDVFTIPERPKPAFNLLDDAMYRSASPGYFSTLQIPLLQGRFFTPGERLTHDRIVIISQQFARQFFPGDDPLGKHIRMPYSFKPEIYEIVGVVADTPWSVTQPTKATVYFPIFSGVPNASSATIVARTTPDPLTLALPIQTQVSALDPGLPVYDVYTLQQAIGRDTANQSFSATLVLAFAVLSLLLAAIGLYGVLSYLVTQRVAEIGIRIALGAQRAQVLRLVLLDGLRPVLLGLAIGLAGGAAAAALIRSMLYGTSPWDPAVFATMISGLLLTAVAASLLPALRASRIDPMTALRTE